MTDAAARSADPDGARTVPLRAVTPFAIVAERLAALLATARALPGLDAAFVETLATTVRLAGGLEPYIAACTSAESPALAALARDTRREDWAARFARGESTVALEAEMLSGHVEGQFLKMLVGALRARRVLEIGCFTGYSALAMAEALPEDGTLVACELDPYAAAFARHAFTRSPHGAKIRTLVGPATASLATLAAASETFDLIFIDADKTGYGAYYALALDALLAPDGLICVDNTLLQGQPYLPGEPTSSGRAIAAFNRMVRDDPRVDVVLLPLRDGVTLVRRR